MNIPKNDYYKIREKIVLLSKEPRPRWTKKLKNHTGYRISVGNYRVVYAVDDNNKTINILDIDNRKDIYKSF